MSPRLRSIIGHRSPLRLAWHRCKAFAAALYYRFPARGLTVIGITGTDGKTTTVGMVAHILNSSGMKAGALSTAFFQIGNSIEWNATQKTSPSPFIVQRFLRRLARQQCTHAVLEYSSHGLTQGRMLYTWPNVAAITNISEEHLDYHGSMEDYMRAKEMLFRMLPATGHAVLNAEDPTFYPFSLHLAGIGHFSYSSRRIAPEPKSGFPVDIWCEDIRGAESGVEATLWWNPRVNYGTVVAPRTFPLFLRIPGSFNIQNALCAIGCAKSLGITMEKILTALKTFPGIPGRMERIDEGQKFSVFVDFTVTPQSYRATLSALKESLKPGRRLLVLTGSCGDRMREKRPIVGKICSELADVVVVTNEDPYTEDPLQIIDEVWAGIDQTTCEAKKIVDRREAIDYLFSVAEAGDAVLLCGKGSDTTMWMRNGQVPWNEREIARELLKESLQPA